MAKTHITVTQRGEWSKAKFDASVAGLEFGIANANSAEEAIGRLILLLSHPLGIIIHREKKE